MPTPKKILIVDDEVNFTKLLSSFFENSGYQTNIANSGIEALRHLREFRYDLILLDLNMPDLDGIHVIKISNEYLHSTKIIVVTGRKEQYEGDLATLKNIECVMEKPIKINELAQKISSILGPAPIPLKPEAKTGTPQAKLLFVQRNKDVYDSLFVPYFQEIQKSGKAFYELYLAQDKDKAISMVRFLRPDIVLLSTDMIEAYPNISKELQTTVAIPKEIIVHGKELYVKSPDELGLDPAQVTAIEGGVYNLDYPKRLEQAVREIAYRHGLVQDKT